jgi:hypothetical protein
MRRCLSLFEAEHRRTEFLMLPKAVEKNHHRFMSAPPPDPSDSKDGPPRSLESTDKLSTLAAVSADRPKFRGAMSEGKRDSLGS